MARKQPDPQIQPSADDELERLTAPEAIDDPEAPTDEQIDHLAEHITKAQYDRLTRAVAGIDRRNEYREKGIRPTTHVVMVSGATILYHGKKGPERYQAVAGEALEIARLTEEAHQHLLESGLAERPA